MVNKLVNCVGLYGGGIGNSALDMSRTHNGTSIMGRLLAFLWMPATCSCLSVLLYLSMSVCISLCPFLCQCFSLQVWLFLYCVPVRFSLCVCVCVCV